MNTTQENEFLPEELPEDVLEEIPMGQSGENESLLLVIEELQKSPSQFAQVVINEIKSLQSRYVLLRLDRDNWRKDYENEKNLSDKLFDCLNAYKNGSASNMDEAQKREVVLYEYGLKRRGLI